MSISLSSLSLTTRVLSLRRMKLFGLYRNFNYLLLVIEGCLEYYQRLFTLKSLLVCVFYVAYSAILIEYGMTLGLIMLWQNRFQRLRFIVFGLLSSRMHWIHGFV